MPVKHWIGKFLRWWISPQMFFLLRGSGNDVILSLYNYVYEKRLISQLSIQLVEILLCYIGQKTCLTFFSRTMVGLAGGRGQKVIIILINIYLSWPGDHWYRVSRCWAFKGNFSSFFHNNVSIFRIRSDSWRNWKFLITTMVRTRFKVF